MSDPVYVHHGALDSGAFSCASCKRSLQWEERVLALQCACGCVHDRVPKIYHETDRAFGRQCPPSFNGG